MKPPRPSRRITTLLVANRGEIATRIMRTARAMGLATVAVYSDADARSPHVAAADLAVRLPGTAAADTYLDVERILDAAVRAGADAVHPGYGFLSESGAFARAVLDAGLVWVGPPAEAMDAMASKIGAKELMGRAGVPTLPSVTIGDAGSPPRRGVVGRARVAPPGQGVGGRRRPWHAGGPRPLRRWPRPSRAPGGRRSPLSATGRSSSSDWCPLPVTSKSR